MDNLMYRQLMHDGNTVIEEPCSYSEIFVYNDEVDSSFDVPLPEYEFEDWLKQQMITSLNLSYRQLESSYTFGPFFWSVTCKDEEREHLQLIFRNISGSKAGHCQGWELALTYMPDTGATTGFLRGTSGSIMNQCLDLLKSSASKAIHPLLLPAILLGVEMRAISNSGLECSRGWLETTEETMEKRPSIQTPHDLNGMEISLLGIHKKVIQRHPQAWMEVVKNFESMLEESFTLTRKEGPEMRRERLNARQVLSGSIAFYKSRLEGLNADVTVTLARIETLRSVIQNLLAVALSNRQQARDNRKHEEAVRYSHNQQAFSVLGVLFLPGTFFAAIFSISFFDFQAPQGATVVSQRFWIFWVITLPTMIILALALYIRHLRHQRLGADLGWTSNGKDPRVLAAKENDIV